MRSNYSWFIAIFSIALLSFGSFAVIESEDESDEGSDGEFTADFEIEDCKFRDRGNNPYFPLKPGYQLVLEAEDEEGSERVEITVLNQKERIKMEGVRRPTIQARVVEEREYKNDSIVEISKNFFAVCEQTGDVFYFGEEVDIYKDGNITHDGAWRAYQNGAMPGIIMPGRFLLGSKYFQEQAAGVAMDRAEHKEMGLTLETEAGTLEDCIFVEETSPLDSGASEKIYCYGIGLSQDGDAQLTEYGFDDD